MDKAIDIKRRAQRFIQSGDLDGALNEYVKLVEAEDSDPYNYVVLADLLFKKNNHAEATERYLHAVGAYERAGLYKSAIALCKKMMRLSLSPPQVLKRLGALHALDGLATEASLYYQQHAEHLAREGRHAEAAESLRLAFESSGESPKLLERAADAHELAGDNSKAARAWAEAARQHRARGQEPDAARCASRAEALEPGAVAALEAEASGSSGQEADPRPFPRQADLDEGYTRNGDEPAAGETEPGATAAGDVAEDAGWGAVSRDTGDEAEWESYAGRAPALGSDPADPKRPGGSSSRDPRDADRNAHETSWGPAARTFSKDEPPGLRFSTEEAPPDVREEEPSDVRAGVGALLRQAEQELQSGDRDGAAATLLRAASEYESTGRSESAAAIYRSLGRGSISSGRALEQWLENAESRGANDEAAEAASQLGESAIGSGDWSAATSWFERALANVPDHELARRRLERLRNQESTGSAAAIRPASVAPGRAMEGDAPAPPAGGPETGRISLATSRSDGVAPEVGGLLADFQREVESRIAGDPQSHYDLGMTYREMGLTEPAIQSFREAARDPSFQQRCAEMIGRCHLDQGGFEEAIREFEQALAVSDTPPDTVASLRFQLGLAHEAAGRDREALEQFERAHEAQPGFADASQKIRQLRRSREQP